MRVFRTVCLSLALLGLLDRPTALAGVSVSPGGQASYGITIAVPPGIAGMAPNLAFSYADGGINGPLGVGWSVQGISTITRCPSTKPVDGVTRAVLFDSDDKLCVDGQRLIQTDPNGLPLDAQRGDAAGLVGPSVREFRTEKDGYSRIRAYGAIDNDVAKGPAYLKVWTKSGQIYHYGLFGSDRQALVLANPTGSATASGGQVGAVWLVSRISDTLGNYIDFKYQQRGVKWGSGTVAEGRSGHEWSVREILYTGAPAQAPANKVVFEYSDRPVGDGGRLDRAEAYQRAHKNVSVWRLDAVKSYVNAAGSSPLAVRTHKLDYEQSPSTGRSRLIAIRECAGASSDKCLPPVSFRYTDTGSLAFAPNQTFASSTLATLKMLDATEGRYGAFTGDFNGDGRTDIIRWSTSSAENELWLSTGAGAFEKSGLFTITSDTLFTADGCHYAIAADFNGDALTDILRVVSPTCAATPSKLFLSKGDGAFTAVDLPATIDLRQIASKTTASSSSCVMPKSVKLSGTSSTAVTVVTDPPRPEDERVDASAAKAFAAQAAAIPSVSGSCLSYHRSVGHNYYVIDADGDGFLDILTTRRPGFTYWNTGWGPVPSATNECGPWYDNRTGDCNVTLHRGLGNGQFEQLYSRDASASMYSDPPLPGDRSNPYWRRPNQSDINGDGLQDILAVSGTWRSNGDGSFTPGADITEAAATCGLPIDFNGDQRMDCLWPDKAAASQALFLHYGATRSAKLAQFNLTTAGNELFGQDTEGRQTIGTVVEDFDGDGRGDILRWGQADGDNGIYHSRGDGSFQMPRDAAGLQGLGRPLQGVDRQTAFLLGDFLGNGTVQILHLKHAPSRTVVPDPRPPGGGGVIQAQSTLATSASADERSSNQLYARAGTSVPADLLSHVTSSSGLVSAVGERVPLPNAGTTYITERGTASAGSGDILDLQPPIYVIPSVTQDTGAGTVTTHHVYKGLKAQRNGRGLLGFRETRQQSPAPNGDWQTVATRYLQVHPYIGVAALTETYAGDASLTGRRLSRTAYSYCDITAKKPPAAIADPGNPPVPCSVGSKVSRPYVHQSVEEGWDLAGRALPRVTTTTNYTSMGDPLEIVVETKGTSLDIEQTVRKTTTNKYFPDQTSGELWILGRLERTMVQSVVPDMLDRVATGQGRGAATNRIGMAGTAPSRALAEGAGPSVGSSGKGD